MSHCVFCAIIAGHAESSVVHDDAHTIAFMDIRPFTRGHLLVVPKTHAANLAELDPADGGRLFQVGQRAAVALRDSAVAAEGINFFLADGVVAGQEVFHVHLHVVPRKAGDGFGLRGRPASSSRPALDTLAGSIRERLGAHHG
ncbi:HIT family protein [Rhodococcus spongiicola]|uniref:HIT domain-containing protein n=1 Tax=Rhodococcus spongiicola TaxID=2487352 RepID=A0A3S3ZRB8_9NOCA|nr:HIT domain-containing protein [Rhodococcus spongiicola]RVW06500.1 HIT domain-containing protein [Rhodococcus spongiicola]